MFLYSVQQFASGRKGHVPIFCSAFYQRQKTSCPYILFSILLAVENIMSLYSVQHFVCGRKRHVPIFCSAFCQRQKTSCPYILFSILLAVENVMSLYSVQHFVNGLLVPECIIHPVVCVWDTDMVYLISMLLLLSLARYFCW